MAKFEVHYNQYIDYDNKVEADIRLASRPTKEEYQEILDAIETLNQIAQKYVTKPVVTKKETK